MAAHSAIGYQLPSGHIKAVYCHDDASLPILCRYYNTISKVKNLIKPGGMSSLRTRGTWERYAENARDPQPLYYHERGDQQGGPEISKSIEDSIKFWGDIFCCAHLYVFVPKAMRGDQPDVGWHHYKIDL